MVMIAELLEVYSSAILKLQTKLDNDQPASLASIRYFLAEFLVGLRDLFLPKQLTTSSRSKAATKIAQTLPKHSVRSKQSLEGRAIPPLCHHPYSLYMEKEPPGLSANTSSLLNITLPR